MISNPDSRTRIDEIRDGIYRISTPVTVVPGGFSFNQYLIVDDGLLLFHTGLRQMFPLVREAIDTVMPAERLRYISFSHYEAGECGSLNDFLHIAPNAVPLCGKIAAIEALKKLINGDVRSQAKRNVMQSRAFSERLDAATARYHANALTTAQVLEELIELAKDIRAARARGEESGLSDEEIAFYDALAENDSAREAMGEPALRLIAHELVQVIKGPLPCGLHINQLSVKSARRTRYPPE